MHMYGDFSTSALWTLWAVIGCPMHYGMYSSISGLHPPDASTITTQMKQLQHLQTFPNVLWGSKSSPVEKH